MAMMANSSLAQVALLVANQLRTKLDLDHAGPVITISRGLRRLGRLVVDRVKYTYLGMQPSFSLSDDVSEELHFFSWEWPSDQPIKISP